MYRDQALRRHGSGKALQVGRTGVSRGMYRFERDAAAVAISLQGCPRLAVGQIAVPLRPEHPRAAERVGLREIGHHPAPKQHDRARGAPGELPGPDPKAAITIDQGGDPLGFQLNALSLRDVDCEIRPSRCGLGNAVVSRGLPNLKIAALHDTHKSLAVTLQFIGRITRKGDDKTIGEATVVTNIADPEAERKLGDLYAEGADWDKIIKRLSEERIEQELRLQDVVAGLKSKGTLHNQLSLWNLRPRFSTQIYRTRCLPWSPTLYTQVLKSKDESWYALDEAQNLLVAVVHREEPVDWGNYQTLEETNYHLLVMWWDQANQALFIYASDYEALRTEQLASIVTGDNARLLSGTPIFQILNNVELPLAKSLGSSRVGAISFTSYFGPNVTEGLASIEKAESELNNIACIGYENGDRVLWGGAKRIPLPTLGMSITLNEIYDTLNVKPRPRLRVVRSDHTPR